MKSRNVHLNLTKMAKKMAADNPKNLHHSFARQLGETNDELAVRIEAELRRARLNCTDASFRSAYARWL